jgi:hypothetical protein
MALILYAVYTFLASYAAGNMTSLQLQHYGIYPFVGRENFKTYIQANNKAAFLPAILPALLMHLLAIVLVFYRPPFVTLPEALLSLALNLIGFVSTFKWQRPLQGEMANSGYDEAKVKLLLSTNWIRTIAFLLLGILTISLLAMAVNNQLTSKL